MGVAGCVWVWQVVALVGHLVKLVDERHNMEFLVVLSGGGKSFLSLTSLIRCLSAVNRSVACGRDFSLTDRNLSGRCVAAVQSL